MRHLMLYVFTARQIESQGARHHQSRSIVPSKLAFGGSGVRSGQPFFEEQHARIAPGDHPAHRSRSGAEGASDGSAAGVPLTDVSKRLGPANPHVTATVILTRVPWPSRSRPRRHGRSFRRTPSAINPIQVCKSKYSATYTSSMVGWRTALSSTLETQTNLLTVHISRANL
jgi:hypothetical protein